MAVGPIALAIKFAEIAQSFGGVQAAKAANLVRTPAWMQKLCLQIGIVMQERRVVQV
jgi:hypothetical protein